MASAAFTPKKAILVGEGTAAQDIVSATLNVYESAMQSDFAQVQDFSRIFARDLHRVKPLKKLGMAIVDLEASGKSPEELCETFQSSQALKESNINCFLDEQIQLDDPSLLKKYDGPVPASVACPGPKGDELCWNEVDAASYCKYWARGVMDPDARIVCHGTADVDCECATETDEEETPVEDVPQPDDGRQPLEGRVNDPLWMQQWGMHNIKLDGAWDQQCFGSSETVVAVIDTGVDIEHEDLDQNIWINMAEYEGTPGVDDDGNGYIDDFFGWNFAGNNNDARDDNMHGTHCSGVIGALQNNGVGVAGINGNVRIMALKFLSSSGGGSLADAVEAVDYAIAMGAHVMSNSWGASFLPYVLEQAVARATQANILFVAAAGNEGMNNDYFPSGPCNADGCLCVASTTSSDGMSWFSNYGTGHVHVGAPGSDILSTVPSFSDPSGYESISGTSMATPAVSALAALLRSEMVAAGVEEPNMETVREVILQTVRPIAALDGKVSTGGVIDVHSAVREMQSRLGQMPTV